MTSTVHVPGSRSDPELVKAEIADLDDLGELIDSAYHEAPLLPPDGGYGWVVVAGSFVCQFLIAGICFSVGIINSEFLRVFHQSKAMTACIVSLFTGYGVIAPAMAALANTYGCRGVVVTGSVIASVAFNVVQWSVHPQSVLIVVGLLGALGFAMMHLPAVVTVNFYFDRRRSLATGIAMCGSGFGGLIIPPLMDNAIVTHGYKPAGRLGAFLMLLGIAAGLTFKHLPVRDNDRRLDKARALVDRSSRDLRRTTSAPELSTKWNDKHGWWGVPFMGRLGPPSMRRSTWADVGDAPPNRSMKRMAVPTHQSPELVCYRRIRTLRQLKNMLLDLDRPFYRMDIFYNGNVQDLLRYQRYGNMKAYVRGVTLLPDPGSRRRGSFSGTTYFFTLALLLNPVLLNDIIYLTFFTTSFLYMAGFYIPFVYLPQKAMDLGLASSDGALLISIISAANIVSHVLISWVTNKPRFDSLMITSLAMTVGGLATILCPLCSTYRQLALYSTVYGVSIASFTATQSKMIVSLMGIDQLTNAFGLMCMFKGAGCCVGPLLAGWLCDKSPSPQTAFYMAGTFMMTAGLVSLTLRPLINKRKRQAHNTLSDLTVQLPLIALHKASTSSDLRSFHSTMFVLQPVRPRLSI